MNSGDPEQSKKWMAALSDGVVIRVRGNIATPDDVEVLAGQTVVWEIQKAPKITITDKRYMVSLGPQPEPPDVR